MKVSETSSAFIDSIANSLGVIIILTLLLVLLSQYAKEVFSRDEEQGIRKMEVKTLCREMIRPWPQEYIGLNHRIVALDRVAIANKIMENTGNFFAEIDEGKIYFNGEGAYSRDINLFRVRFTPNAEAIEKKYPILPKPEIDKKALELLTESQKMHSILFFFVYPSGMDIFASLYPHLIQNNLRFQVVYKDKEPQTCGTWDKEQCAIILERSIYQFDAFEIDYYC